jgi:hypothetical protein
MLLHAFSRAFATGARPTRVLTGYTFRKPDGMLAVTMKPAKFRAVGAMGIYHVLSKEGTVRLEACASLPAAATAPGAAAGSLNYDYNNKIFVNVTALDIVNIVQSPLTTPVRCRTKRYRETIHTLPPPLPHASPPPRPYPPPPPLLPSQLSVSYSDASARGGRMVNRRLDIAPAAAPAAPVLRAGAPPPPKAPAGAAPGLVTLSIANDSIAVTVSLAQQEMYLLRNLLGLSIPHLTGWQYQMAPASFDPEVNLLTEQAGRGGGEDGGGEDDVAPAQAYQPPPPPQQQQQQQQQGQYQVRGAYRK